MELNAPISCDLTTPHSIQAMFTAVVLERPRVGVHHSLEARQKKSEFHNHIHCSEDLRSPRSGHNRKRPIPRAGDHAQKNPVPKIRTGEEVSGLRILRLWHIRSSRNATPRLWHIGGRGHTTSGFWHVGGCGNSAPWFRHVWRSGHAALVKGCKRNGIVGRCDHNDRDHNRSQTSHCDFHWAILSNY